MHPLLTFATGLLAGIVGIRALKRVKAPETLRTATAAMGDKALHGLDSARAGLRDATVTGLSAIEKTSANLRDRLTVPPEPEAPAAKAPRRKTKTAAPSADSEPAP